VQLESNLFSCRIHRPKGVPEAKQYASEEIGRAT
jgi:hypothetical protein